MKILVIPIPKKVWNRTDFQLAVEDAIGAGRRIAKKNNLRQERKRFSLACDHVERIAMKDGGGNKIEFGGINAYKIISTLRTEGKITYPFVLPKEIPKFLSRLKNKVLKLNEVKNGIVITFLPYQKSSLNSRITPISPVSKKQDIKSQVSFPVLDKIKKEYRRRVYSKINNSLEFNQPFNASAIAHRLFTEIIRDYIYKNPFTFWHYLLSFLLFWRKFPPLKLRIIYNDGSEAQPFPLFCLSKISQPKNLPLIKVGMMSMRHEELDSLVDIYLLRNREVDRRESCAEQDNVAYNKTIRFLSEIIKEKNKIEVHLYHTGLEPVVVGTYRAIVEILKKHRAQLVITPKFPIFKNRNITHYIETKPWY